LKHLLIVYHSKSGSTGKMAEAVLQGTQHSDIDIDVRMRQAHEADIDDLLWANGLIVGTPENFGYMSGMMKDFLERTFYPAEGRVEGLPYCIFISASNDGTGALSSLRRICSGYPFKEVQQPIISRGEITAELLAQCEEFGLFMAAGIESAIF